MFRASVFAVLFAAAPASAGDHSLWALYLDEHRAEVCGIQLTDEEEHGLDLAQLRAMVELKLSRVEAGDLYRRARETVRRSRSELCEEASRAELIQP